MPIIFEAIKLIPYELYQNITILNAIITFAYLATNIFLISYLCYIFKFDTTLKTITKQLVLPLFCAILASIGFLSSFHLVIGTVAMKHFYLLFKRHFRYKLHQLYPSLLSIPIAVEKIQHILLFVLPLLYIRLFSLKQKISWILGLILLIFAIPTVSKTIFIVTQYVSFDVLSISKLLLNSFVLAVYQIAPLIYLKKEVFDAKYRNFSFFGILLLANVFSIVIVKFILLFANH